MSDDPFNGAYLPSKGVLTGFDSVAFNDGSISLAETGWSISQLRDFFLNQDALNFPTQERIQEIENLIESHLTDFNNPHETTLNQIVGDLVEQILGGVTPGTPPDGPPLFAYDAACALPMTTFFPATYSATNLYRVSEGGVFVDSSAEALALFADFITGKPGLPLFTGLSNAVATTWATAAGNRINTAVQTYTDPAISYPFPLYALAETNVVGEFGITLPVTENLNTTYTAMVFVMPTVTGGDLIITQPNDSDNSMRVNLATGAVTLSSDAVAGHAWQQADGMVRVAFSFTTGSSSADGQIRIVHRDAGQTATTRFGQTGRPLFVIGQPVVNRQVVNQPVIKTLTQTGGTSGLVLNMTKVQAPATLAAFMITMTLDLYPSLPTLTIGDTTVLVFGDLTVTRTQSTLVVRLKNQTVATSAILEGLNILTISYSPTTIIVKDLAQDRQTVTGSYAPLPTAAITVGPCAGYLRNLAIYGSDDKTKCVEYLTNG